LLLALIAVKIRCLPELGSLGEKQVAALAGFSPINHDSGKYAGKRRIKGGRTWLRHLLYQAALVASNHNPALISVAKILKEKGKPHKLVIIANALLAKNTMWPAG